MLLCWYLCKENTLVIKERIGHEDIETTLGTYGHLYPNYNKKIAKKIDRLFEEIKYEK